MILITGATGQVGGAAVRALLDRRLAVRALVRDPAAADGLQGVEIVLGTFQDERSLAAAVDGVEVLLLAGRDNPDHVAEGQNVMRAAEAGGVRQVVMLSAIGARPDSPIELMRHHGVIEQALRERSIARTIVRPHLYLQNLLRQAAAIRDEGRVRAPMGDRRFPMVDTRDVGEALAVILASAASHAGATYALTGPAAIGYGEIAEALTAVAGRRVDYEAVPPEQLEGELLAAGVPAWRAGDLARIADAYAPADAVATTDLALLLGRPARSLDRFLADHSEAFIRS